MLLISVFFFFKNLNLLVLWYLTGLILFNFGFLSFLDDHDIFIGFLWLIDLGVGLIFFLFLLHFSSFLFFKVWFSFNYYYFFFFFFFVNLKLSSFSFFWIFCLSWYDYYLFLITGFNTDLNLLKEIYFFNNSLEFVIINLLIFYAIFISISFFFLFFFLFSFFNLFFFVKMKKFSFFSTNSFLKQQNFIKQQITLAGIKGFQKTPLKHNL